MTLAETYALAAGVPLDKPWILSTFFPLDHPIEKTVLFHAFAGATVNQNGQISATFPAKIYDHFNEVVALLRPILEPLGYKFYQIGAPNEPMLNGVESLVGKTTIHQCSYLVKNCALLIGNDSMWSHIRGAEYKSQVQIFGSTSAPHFPQWHSRDKAFFIESHRCGKRPSYASHEIPKTINFIPPEEIANRALEALDVKTRVKVKSLSFGDVYHSSVVEMIPNCIIGPQIQIPGSLIVRMDYAKDAKEAESILLSNLQIRKCLIVTDKELSLNLLAQAKPQISSIRVEVDKVSPEWVKNIKKLGISIAFFSGEKDPDKLAKLRLDYYDACLFDIFYPPVKEDFEKSAAIYLNKPLDSGLKVDTLMFATNKFLLSDGKVYLSKAHWLAGKDVPTTDQNHGQVIDSPDFWEDVAHFYIYQP